MIIYENPSAKPPVPHCCLFCGWVPLEGMAEYLAIHGDKAECIHCKAKLPHHPPYTEPYPELNEKPTV
jgi:hypothetical protein